MFTVLFYLCFQSFKSFLYLIVELSVIQAVLLEPPPAAASVLLEYPAPEPESSVSSKEADHPSPLSVLEVPFTEDASSGSECFERVSAELNGTSDFLTIAIICNMLLPISNICHV